MDLISQVSVGGALLTSVATTIYLGWTTEYVYGLAFAFGAMLVIFRAVYSFYSVYRRLESPKREWLLELTQENDSVAETVMNGDAIDIQVRAIEANTKEELQRKLWNYEHDAN